MKCSNFWVKIISKWILHQILFTVKKGACRANTTLMTGNRLELAIFSLDAHPNGCCTMKHWREHGNLVKSEICHLNKWHCLQHKKAVVMQLLQSWALTLEPVLFRLSPASQLQMGWVKNPACFGWGTERLGKTEYVAWHWLGEESEGGRARERALQGFYLLVCAVFKAQL